MIHEHINLSFNFILYYFMRKIFEFLDFKFRLVVFGEIFREYNLNLWVSSKVINLVLVTVPFFTTTRRTRFTIGIPDSYRFEFQKIKKY